MSEREALELAERTLTGLVSVNMQTRDDIGKLRELAEWRLEAKRILPELRAALKPKGEK